MIVNGAVGDGGGGANTGPVGIGATRPAGGGGMLPLGCGKGPAGGGGGIVGDTTVVAGPAAAADSVSVTPQRGQTVCPGCRSARQFGQLTPPAYSRSGVCQRG